MEQDLTRSSTNYGCGSCGDELQADHIGIRCRQGHDLCPECSKSYVQVILSEPETRIPAKCSLCNCELGSSSIERQMDSDQLAVYLMYMAMKQVNEDEKIENCPFCKYFEIWNKACTTNFFY